MKFRHLAIAIIVFSMLTLSPAWGQSSNNRLVLGDYAPQLDLDYVKGDPVDIRAGRDKNVFMVEVWATWCAPCRYSIPYLTKLQEKYGDDGLVILSISTEEREVVDPFVAKLGDEMGYTVAVDRYGSFFSGYLEPFRIVGIPQVFIVNKSGRIIWTGHPMDPIIEPLLDKLLEDKHAKKKKTRTKSRNRSYAAPSPGSSNSGGSGTK